jgi:hypothetical protein
MGLFDDIFKREEVNQLKKALAAKNNDVIRLESEVTKLNGKQNATEGELVYLRNLIIDRESSISAIASSYETAQAEHAKLAENYEAIKRLSAEQVTQATDTINELREALAALKPEVFAAYAERDAKAKELHDLIASNNGKEHQYQERETKLEEKSENLRQERQKLQQQAIDLQSRERHWKHSIEPYIKKYEAHLPLDQRRKQLNELQTNLDALKISIETREADMERRQCIDETLDKREKEISDRTQLLTNQEVALNIKSTEIKRQQAELETRSAKLEVWARELFVFRNRVAQLDKDTEKLELRHKEVESKAKQQKSEHSERLAELRRERSEIRQLTAELNQREIDLNEREKNIKREESQIINIKNKNFELKKEEKRLSALVESLETENKKSAQSKRNFDDLFEKYKALQATHELAQEKIKSSNKDRLEINRLHIQVKKLTQAANTTRKFGSSLSNPTALAWLLEHAGPDVTSIENGWLGSSGHGPWNDQFLESNLEELGYQFYRMPDGDLEYIIVGRKGWSKVDLLAQIEARQGNSLRIYSQEMFFAKLVTGSDPFDAEDSSLLEAFAEDHPALQFLMSLPEPWPTVISEDTEDIVEVDSKDFGVSESPLHILGYRVGATSDLSVAERRKILAACFESRELEFSDDSDDEYISKWGRGGGAQRLYRMAAHIKSLADGRVGKDYRKPQARIDWVNDLKWLKDKYFNCYSSRFTWPGY